MTASGGVRKESAFVAGWVAALVAVAAVTVAVYPGVPRSSTTGQVEAGVELATGLVLAGWLLWRWRHPKEPGTQAQPSWMGRLDTMSPLLAFGLGAFLPTYAVVVAAVTEMISSGLSQGWLLVLALAWVVLASSGVAAPLLVLLRDREHAAETYQRWRTWIVANSRGILYSVGGVVCLVLVAKGVAGLLG